MIWSDFERILASEASSSSDHETAVLPLSVLSEKREDCSSNGFERTVGLHANPRYEFQGFRRQSVFEKKLVQGCRAPSGPQGPAEPIPRVLPLRLVVTTVLNF